MALSGTYNFGNMPVDEIIREAYEQIGITGNFTVGEKAKSAMFSLNRLLYSWSNQVNLWLKKPVMFPLVQGQIAYPQSNYILGVDDLTVTTLTRQLSDVGVPFASSGNAANAFDGDLTTYCNQTGNPNGYLGYDFGVNTPVNYVGFISNTTDASFVIEYSFDDVVYIPAFSQESTIDIIPNQPYWFVLNKPVNARYWRYRALNDTTIWMAELYFSVPNLSRMIESISSDVYNALANKMLQAPAGSYFYDKLLEPNLYIWPTADTTFTHVVYRGRFMTQDAMSLTDTVEVPYNFIDPLITGLSTQLALKFQPDRYQLLKAVYDESYAQALAQNVEDAPLTINCDFSTYSV